MSIKSIEGKKNRLNLGHNSSRFIHHEDGHEIDTCKDNGCVQNIARWIGTAHMITEGPSSANEESELGKEEFIHRNHPLCRLCLS